MNLHLRLAPTLFACFAFVCAADAGPLRRADVPVEPAWVFHLDVDRLRSTSLGKWVLAETEKPENAAKLDGLQAVTGVDLRRQIHGATLFSTSSDPTHGVLVLYADFDPQRLVTLAKSAHEYEGVTHGKHTIHSWLDENKKNKDGSAQRTYAAIHQSRLIFGQHQATVAAALDVLDGTASTLAGSESLPQLGKPGPGVFLQAAARKIDAAETDANAAVFRLSKLVRLDLGETDQRVNATLTFETRSSDVASSISTILEGVLSLVKLQSEKPAAKLAQAITLKSDQANVVASLNMPAEEVIQTLNRSMAEKENKKKESK